MQMIQEGKFSKTQVNPGQFTSSPLTFTFMPTVHLAQAINLQSTEGVMAELRYNKGQLYLQIIICNP